MAFRTFLGPLLLGTQKWGAGRNTGCANVSQTYDTGDLTNTVVGNVDKQAFTLPAGAQILDIIIDQTVIAGTGTMTVSVGITSGGAELVAAVATSAGGRFRGTTTAATQAAWTLGTADVPVFVRVAVGTGTLSAGRALVHISYQMRNSDGSQFPAGFPSGTQAVA